MTINRLKGKLRDSNELPYQNLLLQKLEMACELMEMGRFIRTKVKYGIGNEQTMTKYWLEKEKPHRAITVQTVEM